MRLLKIIVAVEVVVMGYLGLHRQNKMIQEREKPEYVFELDTLNYSDYESEGGFNYMEDVKEYYERRK